MNNFFKKTETEKGVTFIELMVTIFIVMFGITGSIALMQRTISSGRTSSLRFQAAYLAQEGVELVRNVRDTAWVENRDWFSEISTPPASYYTISYNSNDLMSLGDKRLYQGTDDRYSHHFSGTESPFEREIKLSLCPEGTINECVEVRSIVSWDGGDNLIIQRLYNWR